MTGMATNTATKRRHTHRAERIVSRNGKLFRRSFDLTLVHTDPDTDGKWSQNQQRIFVRGMVAESVPELIVAGTLQEIVDD